MLYQAKTQAMDRRELGAGGAISFLGAAFSAAMGFVLVLVLGRALGDAGAGIVFQAIAVFSIALAIGRAGMDSAAIWLLPRMAVDRDAALPSSAWGMVGVSGAAGLLCALVVVSWATASPAAGGEVSSAIVAVAAALPFTAMLMTALSATRALGGVTPYALIGSVFVPGMRPLLILCAVVLGWGAFGASIAWAIPAIPAFGLACVVLIVRLRRHSSGAIPATRSRGVPARVAKYSAPRLVSAVFEQLLIWGGVLVVGLIADAGDAGVYASASRFIAAGMIIDTALRIVIAPMFSRLHHEGDLVRMGAVFRTGTTWLVLFSAPVFLLLAVFSPLALGLLGPEFVRGAAVLSIMSLGALVTLLAGNIHSILLMGGRSGFAALNKIVAVALNLALIPILMPAFGLAGAAWAWVIAGMVDAGLAAAQVRFALHLQLPLTVGLRPLLAAIAAVGAPGLLLRLLLGPGWTALALALVIGGIAFPLWCRLDRARLELASLPRPLRRRGGTDVSRSEYRHA